MKLLHAAAALIFAASVAGCASKPMAPVPMVPFGAPTAASQTPWMTAAGCDAIIARRFGKSC
jgi:hypothetical protein